MREQLTRVFKARINEDNDEQGFTLIELLIVTVILGILAAVTVFGLSGAASQSAVSACKTDARTVEVAMDAFHANSQTGAWPASWADLTTSVNGGAPYLRNQPTNPNHYVIAPAWGSGVVNVEVPPGAQGQNFDTPITVGNNTNANVCDNVK